MHEMLKAGAAQINSEYLYINELNIFPVPDGDTGSNLNTTINEAIKFLETINIDSFHTLAEKFKYGLLMNARGNSGVIFSQIFRGFFKNYENINELDVDTIIKSFENAKIEAYKAVSNPVEGTILTVIRLISEHLNNNKYECIETLFEDVIKVGNDAVLQTTNMLKDLQQAGVVDSGGYGLMSFFNGMNNYLNNKTVTQTNNKVVNLDEKANSFLENKIVEDGFGYCSEVIIKLGSIIDPNNVKSKSKFNFDDFKKELSKIGNSLVCVNDNDIVKVHIHTFTPHKLLKLSQKYGEFEKIKIENMTNQYLSKAKKNIKDGVGLIATVATNQLSNMLIEDYGVNHTIIYDKEIPSVKVFINAINKLNLKNIILLLDDSNFYFTAKEAINLLSNDYNIYVIVNKNIFDSLVTITTYDKSLPLKTNLKYMNKTTKKSSSILISTASKNTISNNLEIKKDQKIAIYNKKIVIVDEKIMDILKKSLDYLMDTKKNIDIAFLICGANYSQSIINKFEKYALEKYNLYCEIKIGEQNIYEYIIGVQ